METPSAPKSNEELVDLIDPTTTTAAEIMEWADAVPGQSNLGRKRLLLKIGDKLGHLSPLVTELTNTWKQEAKLPYPFANH